MNSNKIDKLSHALKIKFGLPPHSPTKEELIEIVLEIEKIPKSQRTDEVWFAILKDIIPNTGKYVYKGLDNSDINQLQSEILALLRKEK